MTTATATIAPERDAPDPSDCPVCGEWRDSPDDGCAGCGYCGTHEHAAPTDADRGGAMDSRCWCCNVPIYRQSFGSFVGPWVVGPSTGLIG